MEKLLKEKMIRRIEQYDLMKIDFPFYVAFIGCINIFW